MYPKEADWALCYDIEDGVIHFVKKKGPDHFVVARDGKALFTGRAFVEKRYDGFVDDAWTLPLQTWDANIEAWG